MIRDTSAPSTSDAIATPKPTSSRVIWVDSLRTIMILLVVNMHACVTYSHVGSWYFMVSPEPSIQMKIPFVFWQGHLQAFFMGLLFFIAGSFADRSLTRKTPRAFLTERLIRLGIPTLIYMLVLHPIIVFGMLTPAAERPSLSWYLSQYVGHGRFIGSTGPMWFAFALLIFSIPFALWFKPKQDSKATKPFNLSLRRILGLGVFLSLASFAVRLVQPVGSSILNFQLCYFPQYIVAFGLGAIVSRRDALNDIATSKSARRAGWLALVLGPVFLCIVVAIALPDISKTPPPFNGGWNLSALAEAFWEQCSGVGLALGAMALCANLFNTIRPMMRWLSDRSFGVYLLHTPILVALAIWMSAFHANIYLMSLVLTLLGWVLSFIAADLARRVPLLKEIL